MDILLADSDRDFLQCYQKLLTMDGHSVLTAFDGAQMLFRMGEKRFDIAVLEEGLPRVEHEKLLRFMEKEKTPVIVLADNRVTVKTLLRSALPNAYLSFPFLPSDLTALLRAVLEKKSSTERFSRCGVEVDVAGFRFADSEIRLTNGEIDLLRALESPGRSAGKRTRVMIQALNEKLKSMGKEARIIYEMERGYSLVYGND